jgi:long-chain acyl-CoA synthetase
MPNFAARISAAAAARPGAPAIEKILNDSSVETMTYGELEAWQHASPPGSSAAGIAAGDRVAILADNDATWIAGYLGILRIGAVAVPLDTAYKPAQVRTVLEHSGARLLFTAAKYLETARAAIDAGTGARPEVVLLSGSAPGIVDATAFTATTLPPVREVTGDAPAVMLYTSGTTADPKGVVLTHANLDAEREGAFAVVRVTESDAILGVLPLFHALAQMANLLLPLAVGARVVFLETVSSSSLVGALNARGISIFACVPQFFYLIHTRITSEAMRKGALARAFLRAAIAANVRLRDLTGLNPGKVLFGRIHRTLGARMRLFVTGGSKFDPAISRDLYGLGFTILNAYGLTETSGGATIVRPGDRFNTSVGQPFPGVEIKVLPRDSTSDQDSDGLDDGEVLIRGPILMREYFNRPDATAEALQDGWLHTGDLGRLDDKGRLFITGRKKEIIVLSSGKNLYPEEIEAHYRQSAFIKELCILGWSRPGEPAAERLHAIVVPDEAVLREKGVVNLRELIRFEIESLSVQLPSHKRILTYDISLDPLPRTTTGKIRRHEIQRTLGERAALRPDEAREESADDRAWRTSEGRGDTLTFIAARLDRQDIRPDANLELDLGLDSMERVELLTVLEQRRGTRVPDAVRATIFTVRQLVEAVETAPVIDTPGEAAAGDPSSELPWDTLLSAPADAEIVRDLQRPKWFFYLAYYVVLRAVGVLCKITPGFRVDGREYIPTTGPCVISPNHQSYLDPFFLSAALPFSTVRQLFFVGATEYFETPASRWFARSVNLIPVDPDANLVNAMQAGAAGLRVNKILVLFPEGERSIDGDLKKLRKGASILSAHLDAPIVPVAIDGLYDLWPRGRPFNWRGLFSRRHPIRIQFGPALTVRRGAYVEGTAALREGIATMFTPMRRDA